MQIDVQEKEGVTVYSITGDIDINSAPDVKKSFDEAIRAKKESILVNLKGVDYVDSSGLATLVEVLKNLRVYGGKLKLSNLSSKVMGLFEITKLTTLFDISDDESTALTSF
jgi:anti-sigma B factor antagonist